MSKAPSGVQDALDELLSLYALGRDWGLKDFTFLERESTVGLLITQDAASFSYVLPNGCTNPHAATKQWPAVRHTFEYKSTARLYNRKTPTEVQRNAPFILRDLLDAGLCVALPDTLLTARDIPYIDGLIELYKRRNSRLYGPR